MGKHKSIESPEQLESLFEQYKEWTTNNPYKWHDFVGKDATEVWKKRQRPITWIGFEGWLCANKIVVNLSHYEHNTEDRYSEFVPIIRAIKKECSADIVTGAMAGVYNHNLAARLEGLAEKKEVKKEKVTVSFKDAG